MTDVISSVNYQLLFVGTVTHLTLFVIFDKLKESHSVK